MENKEVVYFSVNNWMSGENYPPTKNFKKWLGDDFNQSFRNDEWCKENKLCVYYGMIDMSTNYTISAPREWVEKNCPELLTDDEYTYITQQSKYKKKLFGGYETIWENVEHKKKYSDFVYSQEDVDEGECDRVGDMPFREYCEANFGSKYYETYWWGDDEDDEDEDSDEDDDEVDG
jgi:hypothetical protein